MSGRALTVEKLSRDARCVSFAAHTGVVQAVATLWWDGTRWPVCQACLDATVRERNDDPDNPPSHTDDDRVYDEYDDCGQDDDGSSWDLGGLVPRKDGEP